MSKFAIAAAVALAAAAPAAAVNYTTDTATFTGLGDQTGTMFDIVTLNGVSGSASGPGTYLANTVDFTVGINATMAAVSSGTFTDTATVDGSPFTYNVPYTISIDSTDSITIGGNTFTTNGVKVHFNTLTFTNVAAGTTVSGNLTATASVPEPAAWVMMIFGFVLVGAGLRWRRPTIVAA